MIPQLRNASAGYVSLYDTHMVKDASFLRGNNMIFGYTFKPELLQRINLNNLRIYASAQNFFLVMNKDLMGDPEVEDQNAFGGGGVASQGVKWYDYPRSSTFVLGLQIGL